MSKWISALKRSVLWLLPVLFLAGAHPVRAASDYSTERFDVDASISRNHVIHVAETIEVTFSSPHHGIERIVPFDSELYRIRHVKVSGGKMKLEKETDIIHGRLKGNLRIRIGDPDRTVQGKQIYRVSYDLVCWKDFSGNADYLSLDLLPTGWDTEIGQARLSLKLPKKVPLDQQKVYFGTYQGAETKSPYFPEADRTERSLILNGTDIPRGYGVTVAGTLKEGYWEKPADRTFAKTLSYLVQILIPLLAAYFWIRYGRDQRPVRTVEFYPPDGLTPAELGYIADGHVDKGDMSSMLIYFADRGYLTIEETKKNRFRLHRTGKDASKEKKFARVLLKGIFKEGDTVSMDRLPSDFGTAIGASELAMKDYYTGRHALYTEISDNLRKLTLTLAVLLPFFIIAAGAVYRHVIGLIFAAVPAVILTGIAAALLVNAYDHAAVRKKPSLFVSVIAAAALLLLAFLITGFLSASMLYLNGDFSGLFSPDGLFAQISGGGRFVRILALLLPSVSMLAALAFGIVMRARTEKSSALVGRILGFRDFIKNAEYDRLKMLSEKDPAYYYSILPYAYVLGLSTVWSRKFLKFNLEQPEWYDGSSRGNLVFTTLWFSEMLDSAGRSFSGNFNNIPDSGSHSTGGFSGGGFSGGGFGGGGGGAW